MSYVEAPRRCSKCVGTGSNSANYGLASGGTKIPYNTGNCTMCGGSGWMNYNAMLSQMAEASNQNVNDEGSGGPGGIGYLVMPAIIGVVLWVCHSFAQ